VEVSVGALVGVLVEVAVGVAIVVAVAVKVLVGIGVSLRLLVGVEDAVAVSVGVTVGVPVAASSATCASSPVAQFGSAVTTMRSTVMPRRSCDRPYMATVTIPCCSRRKDETESELM